MYYEVVEYLIRDPMFANILRLESGCGVRILGNSGYREMDSIGHEPSRQGAVVCADRRLNDLSHLNRAVDACVLS